ncbi:MAG: L-aspartate oxidase [Dehalococcoidia bacterium]|nr:L-aspartate oxidase [Dehalococcoidia bacterium]
MQEYDYIIIGSGIAGLYAAILAQEHGRVLLLTKGSLEETNTRYAQGGIAAAIGPGDSPRLHFNDTIAAGAGLCVEEAVRVLTAEAGGRIHDLIRYGVPFDTQYGEVALTTEAAHSAARILHAGGDATGEHIENTMSNVARRSGVVIKEYILVTKINVGESGVEGVATLDILSNATEEYRCRFLVLATGGCGRLYKFSTNPAVATGDGVALAYRCGAELMDMEFFQFHPTALRMPGSPPFLITEAIRGEGGILLNTKGRRFMPEYSSLAELAPRDVVARSIHSEMIRTGSDHVYLDIRHLSSDAIPARFPTIYHFCMEHGLDITKELIPVAPAAHYMMAGVRTNVWGETNIPGLFACGEVACTGVHGANRLASNSLLETLVFGKRIVTRSVQITQGAAQPINESDLSFETISDGAPRFTSAPTRPLNLGALQSLMWDKVGIVRSGESLSEALDMLNSWESSEVVPEDARSYELSNLVTIGRLVAQAALMRTESRGAHYRSDYPDTSEEWQHHLVFRNGLAG